MKHWFKFLTCLLILGAFVSADTGKIIINDVEGDVFIKKAKEKDAIFAEVDMELNEGDILFTQKDARAEIIFEENDTLVTLQETSVLQIVKNEKTATEQKTFLNLISGTIINIVNKVIGVNRDFEVKTETANAVVKGTEFAVDAAEKDSMIGVFDGVVNVTGFDAGGNSLGMVATPKDSEIRVVLNQRGYSPEKFKNRMMLLSKRNQFELASLRVYQQLKKSGDLDIVRVARKAAIVNNVSEYLAKHPDLLDKLSPVQKERLQKFLEENKKLKDLKFKEIKEKYPVLIEKYRLRNWERLMRLHEIQEMNYDNFPPRLLRFLQMTGQKK
jgi:hypothetical protein